MRYFTAHNGSYWFQMRVPAALRARYGELVRVNLQTQERSVARQLSLRLAAEWLTRFSMNLAGEEFELPPSASVIPAVAVNAPAAPACGRMLEAFEYWRELTPGRPERTLMEFASTAELFDLRVGKPLAELTRLDVAAFRDSMLADGLAPPTVRKKVGFISTLLQAQVDAGRLAVNAARGLRVPRPRVSPLSRSEFSPEQLQAVFASPVYTRGARPRAGGGEACAWLPVLGLATGARLEELCQLRVEDVLDGPAGSLVLRIDDVAEGQRVKTSSSRRLVPLHPDVIACGFAAYLAARRTAGDDWLFPRPLARQARQPGRQFFEVVGPLLAVQKWLRYRRPAGRLSFVPTHVQVALPGSDARGNPRPAHRAFVCQHRSWLWLGAAACLGRGGGAYPLPRPAARHRAEVSRASPNPL